MRAFRHWTPRYARDRLADMAYQRTHPDAPWLTAHAVSILSTWLKPTDVGFEWGSGRSTVWFAQRVHRLCSVEHDASWARQVPEMLVAAGVRDKVDYHVHGDSDQGAVSKYATIGALNASTSSRGPSKFRTGRGSAPGLRSVRAWSSNRERCSPWGAWRRSG